MNKNNAQEAKIRSFRRLGIVSKILPNETVAKCMKSVIPGCDFVEIYYSKNKGVASLKNVYVCKNIWICPVCARRVAFQRRAVLLGQLEKWQGVCFQWHLTMRHNSVQQLMDLKRSIDKAHDLFKGGKWYVNFKKELKLVGIVASREVTYGIETGWHPHLHELLITNLKEIDQEKVEKLVKDRWFYCLQKVGAVENMNKDDYKFSSKVTFRGKEEANNLDYPIKWGIEEELTLGSEKKGRSARVNMFEMIELGYSLKTQGEEDGQMYINKFLEFVDCYKGTRQLRYDKGLKALLREQPQREEAGNGKAPVGAAANEEEDEVEDEEDDFFEDFELLVNVCKNDYKKIVATGRLLEFQEIYNQGNKEAIQNFIDKLT